MIEKDKYKVELKEMTIKVGTDSWQITISKRHYDKEPKIEFYGDPTITEFAEAFKVLAKADVVTQTKDAIDKVIKTMQNV